MQTTKLVYLLKSLDQSEIKKLDQFVNSPFVNKNETLSALFTLISKYHPAYESPQLAKEKIFAKLFPGEPYKDGRMRYLTSELLAVAENFLIYSSYSNDAIDRHCRLMHELNRRKLDSLFEMRQKEAERMIEEKPADTKALLQHFQVDELSMSYFQRKLFGREYEQVKHFDYSEMIKSLSRFYLQYSLKMYVAMLGQGKSYKKENPFLVLDEALEVLQREMGEQAESTQIYSSCLKMMKSDDEKYFFEIRDKLIEADSKTLSEDEQKDIIVIIINFCLRKYKQGKTEFRTEMNKLHKFSMERNLFLRSEEMSHVQFSNIVMLSIESRDTDWLEEFIESYSVYLSEDVRESTKSFAQANLAYYHKDYKAALNFLRHAKYESPVRQISIKNLLLKIYFERNDTELILPLIDSYLHVVKNAPLLTDANKAMYQNFIRFYQALYRAKQNNDIAQMKEIKKQLEKDPQNVPYTWLLSKIAELLEKN